MATCAQMIKAELKKAFPKNRFSVTQDGWYGVGIEWDGGPSRAQIEPIAEPIAKAQNQDIKFMHFS